MKYLPSTFSTLLILVAVLLPGSQVPDVGLNGIDKVAHAILFFAWAVCIRRDFGTGFRWASCLFCGLLFSVGTEVMQILVEDRTFDLLDMVADVAGLICGIAVGGSVLRWIGRFVRI